MLVSNEIEKITYNKELLVRKKWLVLLKNYCDA